MNKSKHNSNNINFSKIKSNDRLIGSNIIHLSMVDSTMNYAWGLFKDKKYDTGTVVIADEQVNVRGRKGAKWYSKNAEDILCSIMLRSNHRNLTDLLVIASLSVVYTLEEILLENEISIKWPNDVHVDGKKIAGVIAESSSETYNDLSKAVVGIGLNVNLKRSSYEYLPVSTTSVNELLQCKIDRIKIFESLIDNFDILYKKLTSNHNLIPEWKKHLNSIGKKISFRLNKSNQIKIALVEDVDDLGRLIVVDENANRWCIFDQSIEFLD